MIDSNLGQHSKVICDNKELNDWKKLYYLIVKSSKIKLELYKCVKKLGLWDHKSIKLVSHSQYAKILQLGPVGLSDLKLFWNPILQQFSVLWDQCSEKKSDDNKKNFLNI